MRRRPDTWVMLALALVACVPEVSLDGAPCPCSDGYYCCPESATCLARGDATCWSDEALPLLAPITTLTDAHDARDVADDGSRIVVADGSRGLLVAGGTRESWIYAIARLATAAEAESVELVGDAALIAVGERGLQAASLVADSLPTSLWVLATSDRTTRVRAAGTTLFVADDRAGARIYDLAELATPRLVATIASRGVTVRTEGVFVSRTASLFVTGTELEIADGDGGLHLVEVSDPTAPQHLARFPENRYETIVDSRDVVSQSGIAYVADWQSGLVIVDVTDPMLPHELGRLALPCHAVAPFGDAIAIAVDAGWLLVVDVSDPSAPVLRAAYDAGAPIYALRAAQGVLYVAAGPKGVVVLKPAPATSSTRGALSSRNVRTGVVEEPHASP